MRIVNTAVLFLSGLIFASCTTENAPQKRGAIVFGDSTLIVTENDPQYLVNNVPDFVPQTVAPIPDTASTAPVVKKDTSGPDVQEGQAPVKSNNTNGLQAPFKSMEIFVEGLDVKPARNINWEKARGAAFTLNKGDLNNKAITVSGAKAKKVVQRYQTVATIQIPGGKSYKLPGFPVYTAQWQTLKNSGNKFISSGLADKQLRYESKFSSRGLKNALQKLARSNRMSRKEEEQLLRSVRNVRSANQAPLEVALQSVVWKVSAEDARGKNMEREVRVDINR